MCFSILNHISYMGDEIYGIYKIHVFFSSKPYILIERKNLKEEFIMAVNKIIDSTSLSIEVQNGTDKAGDATFTKKTFSNVRNDADPEGIYSVASAIKDLMDTQTREIFVNVSSFLNNN